MNWKKLEKLRKELISRQQSPQKAKELESLAARFGRKLAPNRGRHPIWVSGVFHLPALPIPHHGTPPEVSIGVRNKVLAALWDDYEAWREKLATEGEQDGDEDE